MKFVFALSIFITCALYLPAQNHADCDQAIDICKKQSVTIDKVGGEGNDDAEADFVSCFMNGENYGQAEENSTWFVFEIAEAGTLTFTITPKNKTDDYDFVVFKLPANGNCKNKQIVRCMAAGDIGSDVETSPCMGQTGLRSGEKDTQEDAGCADAGDNTWLAPLKTVKGEKYALLVSNVSSRGPGFTISFGGTCKLPCENEKEPEKVVQKPKEKVKEPVAPVVKPTEPMVTGDHIKVKSKQLQLKIWDDGIEDGDVVSLMVDGTKMLDHLLLKNKPYEFTLDLSKGKEHLLTLSSDDFGKAAINTAKLWVFDGVTVQTIELKTDREKNESTLKILME